MSDVSDSTVLMGSTRGQGLFSLVEAASISRPMAATRESSVDSGFAPGSFKGASSLGTNGNSVGGSSKVHTAMKHRRLSSAGQTRRRLSDAREATSRPSPVMLQSAAAALSSLATLSLSGSPPQGVPQTGTSFASASGQLASPPTSRMPKVEAQDDDIILDVAPAPVKEINGAGISVTKTGKKRGTIFKCESCSKVYRHPSCLIKHRWEHSPHWREASKFLLSKHQQVQLLEAAAILSHLAPSASGGTSLPEDRSLWPSFLSGGLLPPPDQANMIHDTKYSSKARASSVLTSLDPSITYPTSSSVPAPSLLSVRSSSSSGIGSGSGTATSTGRSPSAGPRMHDYAIAPSGGLTHVRPGVVGVPTNGQSPQHPQSAYAQLEVHTLPGQTSSSPHTYPPTGHRSAPVPVPAAVRDAYREPRSGDTGAFSFVSGASISDAWSSPVSGPRRRRSSFSASYSQPASAPAVGRSFSDGAAGWSLPRSSLRERSRRPTGMVRGTGRFGFTSRRWNGPAKIEEEWDGMEMEMEM
ncbi:hypothetical protein V8D89_014228 [Ganoderma adspersum]